MICQIATIAPQSTREQIRYIHIPHGPKTQHATIVPHWRRFPPTENGRIPRKPPARPPMFALRTTYPKKCTQAERAAIIPSMRIAVCPPSRDCGVKRVRVFMVKLLWFDQRHRKSASSAGRLSTLASSLRRTRISSPRPDHIHEIAPI